MRNVFRYGDFQKHPLTPARPALRWVSSVVLPSQNIPLSDILLGTGKTYIPWRWGPLTLLKKVRARSQPLVITVYSYQRETDGVRDFVLSVQRSITVRGRQKALRDQRKFHEVESNF